MNKLIEQLAEPFAPEDIEWRVGSTNADKSKGMALPYITARAQMNRLDSLLGPENWRDEYVQIPGGFLCGLSIRIDNDWITKWDGGSDSDIEPIKGGLSDAFKRAGVKWGLGRYLYDIPIQWVPLEPIGRSWKLSKIPQLPVWALPEKAREETEEDKGEEAKPTSEPITSFQNESKSKDYTKYVYPEPQNAAATEEVSNHRIFLDMIREGILTAMEKRQGRGVTEKARNFAHMMLQQLVPDQDQRHAFCSELFHVDHWSDITSGEIGGFLDWLAAERHDNPDGGKPTYSIPGEITTQIQNALSRYPIDK